jgi:nitrile hydratase
VARFAVGSQVRARPGDPDGHTRVPRYVRGHRGEVVGLHGDWKLPDEAVRGTLVTEPVYAVRFSASDLWGRGGHDVIVELWESYLEEAAGER